MVCGIFYTVDGTGAFARKKKHTIWLALDNQHFQWLKLTSVPVSGLPAAHDLLPGSLPVVAHHVASKGATEQPEVKQARIGASSVVLQGALAGIMDVDDLSGGGKTHTSDSQVSRHVRERLALMSSSSSSVLQPVSVLPKLHFGSAEACEQLRGECLLGTAPMLTSSASVRRLSIKTSASASDLLHFDGDFDVSIGDLGDPLQRDRLCACGWMPPAGLRSSERRHLVERHAWLCTGAPCLVMPQALRAHLRAKCVFTEEVFS